MNSLERTLTTLAGGIPDRVPVSLHNFLMAARVAGIPLSECLQSGDRLAEAQLAAWRLFGHDMLLVESGTTCMAQALGCGVHFDDAVAPRVIEPVIRTPADVDRLTIPDPETTYPLNEMLKAVRLLVRETGGQVFIMGRADQAPLALAAAIRGFEQYYLDLFERPEMALALADKCLAATTRYTHALRAAGAHGTCIGEFSSDNISPEMYRAMAFPRLRKYFAAVNAPDFAGGLHQCGNTAAVLPEMVASGARFLELDAVTDINTVRDLTQKKVTVVGMVSPSWVLHLGQPALVEEKSREALTVLAPGGRFILGPGCALMPETPEANVHTLIETAHRYGQYHLDGSLVDVDD